jgi:hypothetical protein
MQIVEKKSALLMVPGEQQIPVNADHREMCRFVSDNDETYKTFVRSVKLILKGGSEKEIKNEYYIVPNDVSPHFTGRNDMRQNLCDSLITDRHMRVKRQERFVLYGLGGSGKTQVCLKFAQDNRMQ